MGTKDLSGLAFGLTLIASAAGAQDTVVAVDPHFIDGRHAGCQLTFDTSFQDTAYSDGRWVQATGSFNMILFDGPRVGLMLKLGIALLEPRDAPMIAPTSAYLINGDDTNADEVRTTSPANLPGFTLVVFAPGDKSFRAVAGIESAGEFEVGYTRDSGTATQRFTVRLDEAQRVQWSECRQALVDNLPN